MSIRTPCVVALTWHMRDSLGNTLDALSDPVEFLLGGDDLLPAIEQALQGHEKGAALDLHLEPHDAFGDYDEQQVFLLERGQLPAGIEEGMLIEACALPTGSVEPLAPGHLLTVTDVYPEHVVLDGNHPLAGISLALHLKVAQVRPASEQELERRSAGSGFFRLQAQTPDSRPTH